MDDLRSLFTKYLNDNCSIAEIKVLMNHFGDAEQGSDLKKIIEVALFEDGNFTEDIELDGKMDKIYQQLKPALTGARAAEPALKSFTGYFKYAIAAAILLVVSIAVYFYIAGDSHSGNLTAQHQGNDVYPGGNKAILTLADGSKISLTDAGTGELAKQAGVVITKTKDGQLVYQVGNEQKASGEIGYNTISTPAGGQYQVNLPDGTTVWLNALSSLKYPTAFTAKERKVTLTGEGYFEVAKDPSKPFVVATNGSGGYQEVNVLGTHFNINSYKDEYATKTTLLEGRVKVAGAGTSKMLSPGQQSILTTEMKVYNIDADQAVDWKNGNFYPNDEDIHVFMRKLSRWYDVDIIYQGELHGISYGGEISRTKKLSEVLKVLELTQTIHFKIEGRRVTVMP